MRGWFGGGGQGDLAIDLGTANTLVFVRGRGVVVNEPSVVCITRRKGRNEVLAVGEEARRMVGRTPEIIRAIRPLRSGVISDFGATQAMIAYFIKRSRSTRFGRPNVVLSCPNGATPVERRAVQEAAEAAGARRVFLIREPVAAAIGAGLPVDTPYASMVVDSGGGTTEVALISVGDIVSAANCGVGGFDLDETILQAMRRNHGIAIGEETAERIKIGIGAALPPDDGDGRTIEIKGIHVASGRPQTVALTEREVAGWLADPLEAILEGLFTVWRDTPPELAGDILDRGIWLTGGGALLSRMDEFLKGSLGMPVFIADDPLLCGVKGGGRAFDHLETLRW